MAPVVLASSPTFLPIKGVVWELHRCNGDPEGAELDSPGRSPGDQAMLNRKPRRGATRRPVPPFQGSRSDVPAFPGRCPGLSSLAPSGPGRASFRGRGAQGGDSTTVGRSRRSASLLRNPFGVNVLRCVLPGVAAARQPRAVLRNPFGIATPLDVTTKGR